MWTGDFAGPSTLLIVEATTWTLGFRGRVDLMGMSPDEMVSEISRLVESYPGVRVQSAVHQVDTFSTFISLSITSIQSLARIVQISCDWTNVEVEILPGGRSMTYGQPYDESNSTYTIRIPDDDGRGSFANPPAPLHIFGICLARDLKHLGLIACDDADDLQRKWSGAVM